MAIKIQSGFRPSRRQVAVGLIVLTAALGLLLLLLTRAAGPFVSIEPETGSITTGACPTTNDSSASGNGFVTFGCTTPPPPPPNPPPPPVGTFTFYADCGASAAGSGTQASPWNLSQANAANLAGGQSLAFKRGCSANSGLNVRWSNVTIDAYGAGELPTFSKADGDIIAITGSNTIVKHLWAKAVTGNRDTGCNHHGFTNTPIGHAQGFAFQGSASGSTVRDSRASGNYAGVYVHTTAHDNHVLNNDISDNTMMGRLTSGGDDDAGAFGILLWGDRTDIAFNKLDRNNACSYDYDLDGSSVEVFGGHGNKIHHNTAVNSNAFTELGSPGSADNVYAYNTYYADSSIANALFMVTRAGGTFGPVYRTLVYNNVGIVNGNKPAVSCGGCGAAYLTFRNNIMAAPGTVLDFSGSYSSNNLTYRSGTNTPKFVNEASNYHLTAGSPAIDAGTGESVTAGWNTDIDGGAVPKPGGAVDIGADEFGSP